MNSKHKTIRGPHSNDNSQNESLRGKPTTFTERSADRAVHCTIAANTVNHIKAKAEKRGSLGAGRGWGTAQVDLKSDHWQTCFNREKVLHKSTE